MLLCDCQWPTWWAPYVPVAQRRAQALKKLAKLKKKGLNVQPMEVVANRQTGLFPLPGEMQFACDCPDWADMCKHVAAVLYGVGTRLDSDPEMLFKLRGVNHEELVDVSAAVADATRKSSSRRRLAATGISDVFGIDLSETVETSEPSPSTSAKRTTDGSSSGSSFPEKPTGDVIRSWRTELGETQAEFASRLRVSAGSISQWERKGEETFGAHQRTRAALHKAWLLTSR